MRFILLCAALLFLCAACEISYGDIPVTAEAGTSETHVIWQADTPPPVVNAPVETPPTPMTTSAPETTATPTEAPTEIPTEDPDISPDPTNTTEWPETLRDPYPASFPEVTTGSALPNDKVGWYYNRNNEHQPPTAQRDFDIRTYGAHYLGDITQKVVYLTFDEGYENGFTAPILDILLEKSVPAAFFLTKTYIRDNPELSVRIAAEGHIAANHSVRHINFPDLTDEEIAEELTETARYFEETTGYTMPLYFRPPNGEYSVRTLALAQECGYQTIFWSFAHEDWLRDKQPGKETTFNRVMDNLHNGAIILLHAVSESNTEALPEIIDAIREEGYTFGTLYELPDA